MARADKIAELGKRFSETAAYINVAGERMKAFVEEATRGWTAVQGFASALHTVFDIQQMIAAGYKEGQQAGAWEGPAHEASSQEHNEDIARRFENLENELKHAYGNDNFAAATIDNMVKGLRAGVISPNQAFAVIRGVLGPYFSGGQLFQDLANPDPEIRKLAEELERLLAGGTLNP